MDTQWSKQGVGQSMRRGHVQSAGSGPFTGGERAPTGGEGEGAQRWAPRSLVLTSLWPQKLSALGDLNSPAN